MNATKRAKEMATGATAKVRGAASSVSAAMRAPMSPAMFNLKSFVDLATYLSPVLISFLLVGVGLFQGSPAKSMMYMVSLSLGLSVIAGLQWFMRRQKSNADIAGRSAMCDMWSFPGFAGSLNAPNAGSFIVIFSAIYMLAPMIASGTNQPFIIMLLLPMLALDGWSKFKENCTSMAGYGTTWVLGFLGGLISLAWWAVNPRLVYSFVSDSNREYCRREADGSYVCTTLKQGSLSA
jgi:hypothetical protein